MKEIPPMIGKSVMNVDGDTLVGLVNGNHLTINKMTNRELIARHDTDTGFCSVMHHMKSVSTTYKEIVEKGMEIVPDILLYLRDEEMAGMSIILLLMEITTERPYVPRRIENTEMAAWKVKEAREMWLQWGVEKGLLDKVEKN
jgi:hypothetical protein